MTLYQFLLRLRVMEKLPYLPPGKDILYVPNDHEFMQMARHEAEQNSLDKSHPTGAVLVQNEIPIGMGANGSSFHTNVGCVRKLFKVPTGKLYGLCSGCSPKNHAEQQAIKAALKKGETVQGADIYLWGHWWCCESCWHAMIKAGVNNVYLPQNAWEQFGKERA
jgi:deoxycytidylate deaminase